MKNNFSSISLFLGILLFLSAACNKTATGENWEVPPSKWGTPPGTITVTSDASSDNKNEFTFEKWRFTKVEMPNGKVEDLQIALEISTASLTTSWKDLEKNIRKKSDYFHVDKFPKASVSIAGAVLGSDGKYTCDALLTLKGVSKIVPLTFSISKTAPYRVRGEGIVFRSKFRFSGNGPEEEVPLRFDVVLP